MTDLEPTKPSRAHERALKARYVESLEELARFSREEHEKLPSEDLGYVLAELERSRTEWLEYVYNNR